MPVSTNRISVAFLYGRITIIQNNYMKRIAFQILTIAVLCLMMQGCKTKLPVLESPNGKIQVRLIESEPDTQSAALQVSYVSADGNIVEAVKVKNLGINSRGAKTDTAQYIISDCEFTGLYNLEYEMLAGKKSVCTNISNEYLLTLQSADKQKSCLMELCILNDGVAFRYLPGPDAELYGTETTTYSIPEGRKRWFSEWDWNLAYERLFPVSTHGEKKHFSYPSLVEASDSCYVLITESGIGPRNSASSLFNNSGDSLYSVVPDVNEAADKDVSSPWRVMIVGNLSAIVESTLVTDIVENCKLNDISWIKPGVASWIYWAYNHGSNDYQIVKKYIDMAAKLHLPYVLIDAEWDEMKNGGNIEDAISYAKDLGVDCLIWYNSSTAWVDNGAPGPFYRLNKPEDREREFAWLDSMGVKGVKIDFFKGDSQETMEYCIELLKCAAEHHLLVNFHGATLPRGWQRTYPNLMSTEAVRGAEWYNNGPQFTEPAASHNATLPFTRNVVGSMDYTPCTFSDSQFPHITSKAHELALTVLFESGIQHLADKPESYYAQPQEVQDFLGSLPSTWDDTKFVCGYPGEYAVLARRKGNKWYIGGINGSNIDRFISLCLPFDAGRFTKVTVFEDSPTEPNSWKISTPAKCPDSFKCFARGGFVIVAE